MRSVIATQMMMMAVTPSLGPIGSMITDFWNFSESSGTRYDSIAANASNAVPNTSTGTMTGPKGGADVAAAIAGTVGSAMVVTNGTTVGGNLDVSTATAPSHCWFGWAYFATNASGQTLLNRWNNTASSAVTYAADLISTNIRFYEGGSTYIIATESAPTAAAWHFYVMWRDAADGLVRLQIDNGTVYASATPSTPFSQNYNVEFGTSAGSRQLTGGLSRWGWIKGNILTSTQRTTLYNGGPSGALSWADIVAGGL